MRHALAGGRPEARLGVRTPMRGHLLPFLATVTATAFVAAAGRRVVLRSMPGHGAVKLATRDAAGEAAAVEAEKTLRASSAVLLTQRASSRSLVRRGGSPVGGGTAHEDGRFRHTW